METNSYPITQRRLRSSSAIRELTATVKLSHKSFIQPLFVDESIKQPRAISGLPYVHVETTDSMLASIEAALNMGCSKFLLFPVPSKKVDNDFDFSFAANTVREIKRNFGESSWIASDVCLCSYTLHGHCGILTEDHSRLMNHKSVEVITRYAGELAEAGVDCIAPSDMMDGRIASIRKELNRAENEHVSIMSYAAKFSSQFYGPFRDACHSAPNSTHLKDRKTYQVSPFNLNDAIHSALRDEKEGADILMVKPASLYMDVITKLREVTLKPLAAYHVSGEYAAIEGLAAQGLLDRELAHLETWTALVRSGADVIISYAAKNAKAWIELARY